MELRYLCPTKYFLLIILVANQYLLTEFSKLFFFILFFFLIQHNEDNFAQKSVKKYDKKCPSLPVRNYKQWKYKQTSQYKIPSLLVIRIQK